MNFEQDLSRKMKEIIDGANSKMIQILIEKLQEPKKSSKKL